MTQIPNTKYSNINISPRKKQIHITTSKQATVLLDSLATLLQAQLRLFTFAHLPFFSWISLYWKGGAERRT